MAQPQDPAGKPQGIIRTMQQDIDRAQGRGGDAFEEIASSSPLPPPAPQKSPEEILGMDIPLPDSTPTPPSAPPVFEPAPTPAPVPTPSAVPTPAAPPVPVSPSTPQLSDEELDALLPLDGGPSATGPSTAPTSPDFGSVARRATPTPTPQSSISQQAPPALPMDDISPIRTSIPTTNPESLSASATGSTPPPNLPTGNGPQLPTPTPPSAPPVFEPAPTPAPVPTPSAVPTPAAPPVPVSPSTPQPIPPFNPPSAGLEEGEELPGQTPEELLGLGIDIPQPAPMPQQGPAEPAAVVDEKPVFVEEKSSPLSSRALIIVAGGLFVAALAGTLAYFFFFASSGVEPIQEEPVNPPSQETPAVPPSPLVTPDRIDELSIAQLSITALQTALSQVANEDLQPGSLTYLPVRLTETTNDGREQYLTAQLFFSTLGVALPEEFLTVVDPTFMLYAYGAGDEEDVVCTTESEGSQTCPGPRLGIILQAREGQEENVAALIASWTALDISTFEPLILDEATLATTTTFQQGTYAPTSTQNAGTIPLYYANLPHSATALNFAVAPGGKIVIGTSKNSLYAALDAILEAE